MSIGTLLLAVALLASLVSLFFTAKSISGNRLNLARVRQFSYLSAMLIFFAFLFLLFAFLNDDFSLSYVYLNSSSDLHTAYKVAALWADKAGSLLLWLLFLAMINIVLIKTENNFENIVVGVITITEIFLLLVILMDSPFRFVWETFPDDFKGRNFLPPGLDGFGMNPLLIDPWMVSHPPFLLLGYASATVPFAYAIAALLKKDPKGWLKPSYRWTLFSMMTLGIGIFLGCYWAYKVLGWGGFWGWDPVENSSLVPWLVAVVLFHSMILQKRKNAFIRSNLLFSLLYLILVFYSTFLTRSGVLANFSVHSFGGDSTSFGIFFFIIFYIVIGGFLFAKRFKNQEFKGASLGDKFWTWENFMVYGILSLLIFAGIVLIGTSMPILSRIFSDTPVPVTANFYNNLSIPFALMILIFITLAAIALLGNAYKKGIAIIIGIASILISVLLNYTFGGTVISYVLAAVAVFVVFHCIADLVFLKNRKSILSSRIAHIGVALLILGSVAAGYYGESFHKNLVQGEEAFVGPVALTFEKFNPGEKSSLSFLMKTGSGSESFDCLYYITNSRSLYREPHISSRLTGDIYIVPEEYSSGRELSSIAVFASGEIKTIGDCTVLYQGLKTKGMMSDDPATYAEIIVNGRKLSPGIKFKQGHRHEDPAFLPGTNRKVRLMGFDPVEKLVQLYIDPAPNAPVIPDTVLVELSLKRLIWVVWLGMLLITVAGIIAFYKKKARA